MIRTANYPQKSRTNDTWTWGFTWKTGPTFESVSPVDLTGATAKLQIRDRLGGTVLLTAATGGQGITLGGAAGTVAVVIAQATLAALAPGVYAWDLVVTDSLSQRHCRIAGAWTHEQGVTLP